MINFNVPPFVGKETEYIKQAIDNLVKDHTVVIVAHRLSTIIDAHHRGYEFIYVADATAARRTEHFDEITVKNCVVDIAKAYCHVVNTSDILKNI